MIAEAVAVFAIPTAGLLAGRALAATEPRPLPLPAAAVLGALAPAAAMAYCQRSFVEQTMAWALGVVGWGGLLLGRDPYVLAASMLAGGVWGGLVALPASAPPPGPASPVKPELAAAEPAPEDGGDDQVRIELPCPSCGAAVAFPVYHAMAQCPFCGSRHLVRREDTTLEAVIPNAVHDEAAVAAAVLAHLKYLKYLELYDRMVRPLVQRHAAGQPDGPESIGPALDGVSLAAINAAEERVKRAADAYAARLAPQLKVLAWQPFLAPYWHRGGTLYQVAFGRYEDGAKTMDLAITHLEGSQPGSAAPLPDMGKLSYLKNLRPLYGAPEAALPAFPVEGGRDELHARLEAMHQRSASFSFRTIAVRGVFVPQVDALVWRPWHAARVAVGEGEEEFLVDGASARVAAQRPPSLTPLAGPPPQPADQQIRLAPSRCPVCGADLPFVPDAAAHLCRNCLRLLDASGRRLQPRPYLREDPAAGHAAVPFWRFPLALRTAEGAVIRDLAHLGDRLDGVLDQVGDRPQLQSFIFVPAFRLRLTRGAVRFYRRLWPLLHGTQRHLRTAPYDVTSIPVEVWPLNLPAGEARVFGAMYLALSFTSRDLARAEIRGVRARFLDGTLEGEPEPAYLSLPAPLVSPFRGLLGSPQAPAVARLGGR